MEDENVRARARAIAACGHIDRAIAAGSLPEFIDVTASEGLLLGLLRQGITKYLGILGHGNTDFGEILRVYCEEGVAKFYPCRNEVSMAHAATALAWAYKETPAVLTSIGPGALQAYAGSLAAASNGVGIYHIYGDETTRGEGYNMQQIPRARQNQFGRLTEILGDSYTLHTAEALREALHRGTNAVHRPYFASPFYLCFPINVQPKIIKNLRLTSLPGRIKVPVSAPVDEWVYAEAAATIRKFARIAIKLGGGSREHAGAVRSFLKASRGVAVLSPGSTGVVADADPQNMHVGGSKGSISGNYAMENCELLIVIGSRSVCQADCSGTGYPNAQAVININGNIDDASHYNNTQILSGDISAVLSRLTAAVKASVADPAVEAEAGQWLAACAAKKAEWSTFKAARTDDVTLRDPVWQRTVLTQPSAVKTVADFAKMIGALKVFDAGDVQANGFQLVEDDVPFETITETGASYMGFATSAISAAGIADDSRYMIAFTGDGSFMMNPQILIDALVHKAKGMVVVFDNRRMGAISSLQASQFGPDFGTSDDVAIDFATLASSVDGVLGLFGGYSRRELWTALEKGHAHDGLSLIHVPVFWGDDPLAGLGAYGRWNVGPWVTDVERLYSQQSI
ncbi:thiamine pyrophosphate-dependent enzyme [Pseudorhodoplanes sp.]|uniref:thiamine pyrophosphate-dependent enzyme n=1 Tax=Pseudorhodoplanes sp. TaxID=1934341 RepID=UPI002B57BCEC|nr:thiamine pyrophosphate-dependent enzyme [Pseudorhodoplanes sp.]HWV55798.1 thiamine pyrophosphate-dependent enzyme [Pseudorhodoplanes sp.]